MTHFLTTFLIIIILVSIAGVFFITNKPIVLTKSQVVQTTPVPTPTITPLSPEEETAKLCGEIPEELLGIKESPYINIEHLLWAPGCNNFGFSISWNIPDNDKRTANLQPKGVFVHSIPDKKTVRIPFPQKKIPGYFLGWYSDHEMSVTDKFNDDPYNTVIYDIQTGQYHK